MSRCISWSEDTFAMSSVIGKFIVAEKDVPFSFYYFPKNSNYGPKVKPVLNPNRMNLSGTGVLRLCGNWKFTPGPDDKHHSDADVARMRDFFRKYLVLFLLVWDTQVPDPELEDYFRGDITLKEFIHEIDFYPEYSSELAKINSVSELEQFCRDNDLVNFYGN